jgi:hypothetical protein
MKTIFKQLKHYFTDIDKRVLLQVSALMAFLIILNYTIGIEPRLSALPEFSYRVLGFSLLYFSVFAFSYWTQFIYGGPVWRQDLGFFLLLCLGPLLFAIKISWQSVEFLLGKIEPFILQKYLNIVVEWPLKCLLLLIALFSIWRIFKIEGPLAGMVRGSSLKPYLILLLCMVPLLSFAATQSDFQEVYPKLRKINFLEGTQYDHWWSKLLFELSYGTDFLSIETFFRGFLILGFIKYVGKNAILPMAAFYCSIHFGKPLLECISSYFGGIILGVIVYYSRSIWGGLLVHLGIAWLMELAGYLATYR